MSIVDLVKYNGNPETFAWKYPSEELSTWTQLIVNESQEAVLFKGGTALDIFGSGRHTLDTANIPLLIKFAEIPFGMRSPFTAEVWYVNKVYSLDIKWGTPTPIQIQDPKYGIFIPVRAYGQFGIRISDSKKFLVKLVGTLPSFDKAAIQNYFRGLYVTKAKDSISSYIINNKISVIEINAKLDELSAHLQELIEPTLDEYGIELVNFYVNDINVPEDDPAVMELKAALSKRAEMDIVGYNYQQERSFDTLEGAAKNPGSGAAGMMGAGLGLGMGVGLGAPMGAQMGGIAQAINTNASGKSCPKCGAVLPSLAKFCPECGAPTGRKCPKCGIEVSASAKFCPECGEKL